MTENFEILSPRAHCRLRPQMWIGSTSKEEIEQFVLGKWKPVKCVPALSKMVDEICSNSVDENGRSLGKFANKIDVSINGNTVTVTDNGRGIPQDEITDTNTGEKLLRPVAAWTRTNAGTSFGENRTTIGAHGLGSALVNFMSTEFIGKTWRDGNLMEIHCTDGGLNIEVKQKKQSGNGTSVTFTPDFSLFEVNSLSELDTIELIEDRLMGLQLCFPEIAFSFNKERVKSTDLKKYSELFVADGASVIIEKSDNLSFFFCASVDGFRTNSFINGVNTRQGGTYVDYIVNCVVEELLVLIKRKHKIEVVKSVLKNGLTFILFARNFINPKFDSQTKERLTNPISNVKEHFEKSGIRDFKAIAKKLFAADDIIQPIIAAQIAKKNADETRDALVAQKKLKKVKVAKHIAATSPDATLCLVEGLSALGYFLKRRDPKKLGAYPLRGVVMNTWDMKPSDVLKNKELSELIAILGIDINDPESYKDMTYKTIATLTDADQDGIGHICPLIIAFFYKFWPGIFEAGRMSIIRSPVMISSKGKDIKWFYDYAESEEFKQVSTGYSHRHIKGLGSLTEEEYFEMINNPQFDIISVDNSELFEIMFGGDADARKKFMMS